MSDGADGPRDTAHLRAGHADRERVTAVLTDAVADGRLTMPEFEERTAAVQAARTLGDLVPLTADLVAPDALPAPATRWSPVAAPGPAERLLAVFGNDSRRGHWVVPAAVSARSVFGDCHVDLTDATLTEHVTRISASALFGAVTIVVPEGVEVRLHGRAVFGERSSHMRGRPAPGAPVVEVSCDVLFGSVSVRPPRRQH